MRLLLPSYQRPHVDTKMFVLGVSQPGYAKVLPTLPEPWDIRTRRSIARLTVVHNIAMHSK